MEAMTLVLDDREWTLAERDALPDDGCRYELIDGALVVTPSPGADHQRAVRGLFLALDGACPPEFEIFFAPFDVLLDPKTAMQPDLLVARREDVGERGVTAAPVLAVEVLSPSTQVIDRNLKLQRFERAGMPNYWLVDPKRLVLSVYELADSRYQHIAEVAADETWTTERPFPVTIEPGTLLH